MLKKRVHVYVAPLDKLRALGDPLTPCKQVVSTCYNETRPRIAASLSRDRRLPMGRALHCILSVPARA